MIRFKIQVRARELGLGGRLLTWFFLAWGVFTVGWGIWLMGDLGPVPLAGGTVLVGFACVAVNVWVLSQQQKRGKP